MGLCCGMARFYFHVRQGNVRFEDKHGADFPDLRAAWCWALQDARVVIDQQLLSGPIAEQWIEIGDHTGVVVASLSFERLQVIH